MIAGIVNAEHAATIRIILLDSDGQEHEREAIVDTGFTGWLTLPANMIALLDLPWKRYGRAVLADGSDILFYTYEGTVLWDGAYTTIPIDESEGEILVGMSLMYGYSIHVENVDGGAVTLQRLP